jgi:vacuolar-type H+-ATPase subunit E/Vma4
MAMEELIRALERDAAAEAEENLRRARVYGEELLAAHRRESAERLQQESEEYGRELRARGALEVAAARREGRNSVLVARDELLGRVRAAVDARLHSLCADDRYRARLGEELLQACAYLPESRVEARCHPALADALAEAAGGVAGTEVAVSEESSFTSGFVLGTPGGRAEVDARLDTRIDRMWPELALTVMAMVEKHGWCGEAADDRLE